MAKRFSIGQPLQQRRQLILAALAGGLMVGCAGTSPAPSDRREKFALVLGGGAARGFAHIGVIKVLEANGISIPYLCRGGACGQCETRILRTDCAIEHHDVWLSEAAKACNSHFMPCISRADGGTLVVDL